MTLKKTLALILAVLTVLLSFVACGDGEENANAEPVVLTPLDALDRSRLGDYTVDEEKRARVDLLRKSFEELPETDASHFLLSEKNGEYEITKYLGTGYSESVRIPAQIGGKPVTSIKSRAFERNTDIKAMYIPDSVTLIEDNILTGSTDIRSLRVPFLGSSRTDTDKAFLGYFFGSEKYTDNPRDVVPSLRYLELGEGMTELAEKALFECNDLELITLPESMTKLGTYSLYGCTSLLALNVDGLSAVEPHALHSCASLTRLVFSEKLTSIGIGALEGCVEMRMLTLPFVGGSATENRYLGYIFGAETPDFAPGYYPQYLTRIKLLETCTSLDDFALYECDLLTEIDLPETLTTIGTRAFSGCLYLEGINFPHALTEIGDSAFFGCRSLKILDLSQTALNRIGTNAFYFCDALAEVRLPASLNALPPSCFAQCNKLAAINLENVAEIGKNAFRGCPNLPQGA